MRNNIPIPTNNYLMHAKGHKYIKKIKTNYGYRYFYTPAELKAFYEEGKTKYNKQNSLNFYSIGGYEDYVGGNNTISKNKEKFYENNKMDPKNYRKSGYSITKSKSAPTWRQEDYLLDRNLREKNAKRYATKYTLKQIKKLDSYKKGKKAVKKIKNLFN